MLRKVGADTRRDEKVIHAVANPALVSRCVAPAAPGARQACTADKRRPREPRRARFLEKHFESGVVLGSR